MRAPSESKGPPPPPPPTPGIGVPETTHEPFPLIAKLVKLIRRK
jgi:hypothetical protein